MLLVLSFSVQRVYISSHLLYTFTLADDITRGTKYEHDYSIYVT